MEQEVEKWQNELVLESISKLEYTQKLANSKRSPNKEKEVGWCTRDANRDKYFKLSE